MNFEMKLVFSKKADMNLMAQEVMAICDGTGTTFLEQTGNTISYGSDSHDQFGPAFVDLCFSDDIKNNLLDAIWTDLFDGSYSCKSDIFKVYL